MENDLKEEEKKVVSAILDDSPLAKEFNKYVDVNPEDVSDICYMFIFLRITCLLAVAFKKIKF